MHGGFGPHLHLDDLKRLKRPIKVWSTESVVNILWSDPNEGVSKWQHNLVRRCSLWYGREQLLHFLNANGLQKIIRGHEPCRNGFNCLWDSKLVTVFTASNYIPEYLGAIIYVSANAIEEQRAFVFSDAKQKPNPVQLQSPKAAEGRRRGSSIRPFDEPDLDHSNPGAGADTTPTPPETIAPDETRHEDYDVVADAHAVAADLTPAPLVDGHKTANTK